MQYILIPLGTTKINTSLQVGDSIYYCPQSDVIDATTGNFDTGFNQSGSWFYRLGILTDIYPTGSIKVIYDDTVIGTPSLLKSLARSS